MILRLLLLTCLIIWVPSPATAAATRTIEVQLSFDASAVPGKTVRGYKLYQDSLEACVTNDSSAASIVCDVTVDDGVHRYEISAHYTDGTESPKSPPFEFAFAATEPPPSGDSSLPTAVISSSATNGQAPLTVVFDSSASHTASSSIVSRQWNFGDGITASGVSVSHTFPDPGTFTATLTITDATGKTDTEVTPIVVTESNQTNQAPTAIFSVVPTAGEVPLSVTFDGTASSDSDGSIASYFWNFGDGYTATGKSVEHVYSAAAVYTVTLQVTDNTGASSPVATKSVTVEENQSSIIPIVLNYEVGELALKSDWVRVQFATPFTAPAVFIGPPTSKGPQPVTPRIQNLDATGFDIRLQEWDYLDDKHVEEKVSFLVIEQGTTILPGGSVLEVGTFTGKTQSKTISFHQRFPAVPIVLSSIQTRNGPDAVMGRPSQITQAGFSYTLQEQESTKTQHVDETVAYLALSKGKFLFDNILITSALSPTPCTDAPTTIAIDSFSATEPFFFAEQQTMNGWNTAALRIKEKNEQNVTLYLQEEQSLDEETLHVEESVGYIAIAP